MTTRRSRRRLIAGAAIVLGFVLVAVGCGGGGGDDDAAPAGTEAAVDTSAVDAGGSTTDVGAETTAATVEPVRGGKAVFGVEAETANPWRPQEMACASACFQVIRSIYDSLTLVNDDGEWFPYLAESLTPNDDHTVWTIKAREGVTFHDGTPFDGEAIRENLERSRTAFLTGAALADVTSVAVSPSDPMAADVTMKRPWVTFPYYVAAQIGLMASPTWLEASDADETLRTRPVGTGPFVYADYKPNEVFRATRNPDYWNQPYPYLDEVEFRPIPDALVRRDALKAGDVDIIQTTNGETIAELREAPDEYPMVEHSERASTQFTLLHVSQDGSPLRDQRVRCALANATDAQTLIDTIGAGVHPLANGPFSPDETGYLEDTGYPQAQDMAKAQALIAEYKVENPGPLRLSLATTQDETNLTVAQFQKQWYEEAGVDQVSIDQKDQGQYILDGLLGVFQVYQSRGYGGYDLDNQYVWWHSSNARPVGEFSLNASRLQDPVIDEMLDRNREETDPAEKQDYAEAVNRQFAEQCYSLWISWTVWALPHSPRLHAGDGVTTPEGETSTARDGVVSVATIHRAD